VAKKKGTRKGAARGARKKPAVRRSTRKAASRPRTPRPIVETGLENPRRVNLRPLKAIITAQIERLETYERRPDVENALKLLRDTKAMLSNACSDPRLSLPMVIEIGT
jgi:hypothetical protein